MDLDRTAAYSCSIARCLWHYLRFFRTGISSVSYDLDYGVDKSFAFLRKRFYLTNGKKRAISGPDWSEEFLMLQTPNPAGDACLHELNVKSEEPVWKQAYPAVTPSVNTLGIAQSFSEVV